MRRGRREKEQKRRKVGEVRGGKKGEGGYEDGGKEEEEEEGVGNKYGATVTTHVNLGCGHGISGSVLSLNICMFEML